MNSLPKFEFKHYLFSFAIIVFSLLIPIAIKDLSWVAIRAIFIHLPLMLALFICPETAVLSCLACTLGYYLVGASSLMLIRSLTHIIFILLGSYALYIMQQSRAKQFNWISFSLILNAMHGLLEATAIFLFSDFERTSSNLHFWYSMLTHYTLMSFLFGSLACCAAYLIGQFINQHYHFSYFRLIID